jgi:hypothetical protein
MAGIQYRVVFWTHQQPQYKAFKSEKDARGWAAEVIQAPEVGAKSRCRNRERASGCH